MEAIKKEIMMITGSAPCVLEDIDGFFSAFGLPHSCCCFMIIGLSASGMHAIYSRYMATYHPNQIPEIKKRRESIGGNTDYTVISHLTSPGVDIIEPLLPGDRSGSSSLLGALAAIKLGYDRIVLCGCPLEGKNNNGSPYDSFRVGWENKKKYLNDRVRSMSGWTRELLGAPTQEWLMGGKT